MTLTDWKTLQIGEYVAFIKKTNSTYYQTICLVINTSPLIKLRIVQPNSSGETTWTTGKSDGYFSDKDFLNFKKIDYSPPPIEDRIISKIKTLDKIWAQKQSKKGNKYAMLCL